MPTKTSLSYIGGPTQLKFIHASYIMNSTIQKPSKSCNICDPLKLSAILNAFRSPYASEAEPYKSPQSYFLMTTEMEITDFTNEPSIKEGQHCVAASDTKCNFIVQFQINWPGSNPNYQQLETFRAYHKARQALFDIKQDYPKKKHREHKAKIEILRNLP